MVADYRLQFPDGRFPIPDSGFRISDSGFRIPDYGVLIPESGIRNRNRRIQRGACGKCRLRMGLFMKYAALGYFLNQHLQKTDEFSDVRAHLYEIGRNGQGVRKRLKLRPITVHK